MKEKQCRLCEYYIHEKSVNAFVCCHDPVVVVKDPESFCHNFSVQIDVICSNCQSYENDMGCARGQPYKTPNDWCGLFELDQ